MQTLMNMMNMMKGWGPQPPATPEPKPEPTLVPWNEEDYQAYLKWCAEAKFKWDMLNKTSDIVEDYREKQAALDAAKRAAREKEEMEERSVAWMTKWNHWQNQLQATRDFDMLNGELWEMKNEYYQQVALSFVQLCPCNDYAEEISLIFSNKALLRSWYDINVFTAEDLRDRIPSPVDQTNATKVAEVLNTLSKVDQTTLYFSGLHEAMCDGARDWLAKARDMEREYGFLGSLADTEAS